MFDPKRKKPWARPELFPRVFPTTCRQETRSRLHDPPVYVAIASGAVAVVSSLVLRYGLHIESSSWILPLSILFTRTSLRNLLLLMLATNLLFAQLVSQRNFRWRNSRSTFGLLAHGLLTYVHVFFRASPIMRGHHSDNAVLLHVQIGRNQLKPRVHIVHCLLRRPVDFHIL